MLLNIDFGAPILFFCHVFHECHSMMKFCKQEKHLLMFAKKTFIIISFDLTVHPTELMQAPAEKNTFTHALHILLLGCHPNRLCKPEWTLWVIPRHCGPRPPPGVKKIAYRSSILYLQISCNKLVTFLLLKRQSL